MVEENRRSEEIILEEEGQQAPCKTIIPNMGLADRPNLVYQKKNTDNTDCKKRRNHEQRRKPKGKK